MGFVYVILNIRGGGEMGKHWYDDGRMFNKMNTFNDFNDGVNAVLDKGIGSRDNVFARGGSAGGLLMGAIINLEPELYKGILSGVPFVDVLTTMSDPTIPLTTFEYDEWSFGSQCRAPAGHRGFTSTRNIVLTRSTTTAK